MGRKWAHLSVWKSDLLVPVLAGLLQSPIKLSGFFGNYCWWIPLWCYLQPKVFHHLHQKGGVRHDFCVYGNSQDVSWAEAWRDHKWMNILICTDLESEHETYFKHASHTCNTVDMGNDNLQVKDVQE
jgi:hypothetical protein